VEGGLRGPPLRGRRPYTLELARERGIRRSERLENHDVQGSLQALCDSVMTGPMRTQEFRYCVLCMARERPCAPRPSA
jgi:hypothetical protein